jgi:hypothetical protein
MRKGGLAALVAILVVASLGIGYLSGTSARATETVTSVSTSTVTSTTTSISTSNVGVVTQLVAGTAVNHQVSDQFGGAGVSFPLYQTIPVTVYASSPTTTSLAALSAPSDAWVYLGTNSVTATPAGAVANITMMGAYTTDSNASDAQALVVGAPGANTTFYVRPSGFPFAAISNASSTIIPNVPNLGAVDDNQSATDPWTFVYAPSDPATAPSSLSVSLQVLGLEVNGSLQAMPSFLKVGFLNSTFTLSEYQPAFDAAHVSNSVVLTAIGSHENYQVAVKQTVDGSSQIAYVQVEIVGPTGFSA